MPATTRVKEGGKTVTDSRFGFVGKLAKAPKLTT